MMSNIKVAVRVRPLNKREIELGSQNVVEINGDTISVANLKSSSGVESQPEYADNRERVKLFTFDYCYDSSNDPCLPGHASQQLVFQDLGTEILEAAFEGYNACVFAYGQTSTGKTYTMMGDPGESGLIPRICEGLFSRVDDFIDENFTFKVDISYLEIYNERVRDLLQSPLLKPSEKYTLKVREHPKEGPYVQDLSRHLIKDNNEIQALIEKANENRTTSSTHMHEHSSRSHAIVTVTFTQARLEDDLPSEIISKVHLVDLAGSERASTTTTTNYKDRLKEGANINKSLVTLGNVIKCLAERSLMSLSADDADAWSQGSSDVLMTSSMVSSRKQRTLYVPYRDSVLTWLLKDSLGGNSKTIMISTISPASIYYNETVSTLRYAQRAKSIINKPKINEDSNVTLIKELRREIEKLRDMLVTAQTKAEPEPCPDTVEMKGNLVSLQESSTFLSEKLEENEAAAKKLTMHWIEKWQETHDILTTEQLSMNMTCAADDANEEPLDKLAKMLNPAVKLLLESDLSIRRPLGQRTNSMGVIVDSQQPHLRGMDDDILSTGIVLYYLKEGKTLIGGETAERDQDIVLSGVSIQPEHCFIQHIAGEVVLHPNRGSACSINGIEIKQPTKLTQGDTILIGKTHLFRFNNPAEAARLREFRKSVSKNETENGSHLGSMDSVAASESGSSSQNGASPAPLMSNSYTGEFDETCKNNKSNIKQIKQELHLVTDQLQKMNSVYARQEEQMWEMQEKHKQDEEELRQQLSDMLANANQKRLMAEKEISKAKARMDKETALFKRTMDKELCESKEKMHSPAQSSISDLEKIKNQLQEELVRKSALHESKKVLELKVHEMQKLCHKAKLEVGEHEQKVVLLKKEHEMLNQQKKQEISSMRAEIKNLKQQKEDLQMCLDEKKDLRKVAQDKPAPLRGACSEETVCYEAQRSPSFMEIKDLKGDRFRRGSDGDPSLSNRVTMSTTSLMSESLVEEPHEYSPAVSESPRRSSICSESSKNTGSRKDEVAGSKSRLSALGAEDGSLERVDRNCVDACSESIEKGGSEESGKDLSMTLVGDDECDNGVLAEDQMSNYSQDSLDRMEDVEPDTEAASVISSGSNPSNPNSKRLETKRTQKSASPCRQSGIPVAKHSPSPVRKLNEQNSSSKSNSASSKNKDVNPEIIRYSKTKTEPRSKTTSSLTGHDNNECQIQNSSPQNLNSCQSGSNNPADKTKAIPDFSSQSKCRNLANVREGQNKDRIDGKAKRADLTPAGTTSAQHYSKNSASSSLVSNQSKSNLDQKQLAKKSGADPTNASAVKERMSSGMICKQSQLEEMPDENQHSPKNCQVNSKSKQATPRIGTSEMSFPHSKIQDSNPRNCSSPASDSNQKVVKDRTNKPASLSHHDSKPAGPSSAAKIDQKHRTQDQACSTVPVGKHNLPFLPKESPEELQNPQLKNPASLTSHQPRNPVKEPGILKNQAFDNPSVGKLDQHVSSQRQAVPGRKPLQKDAKKIPMMNGKSANQIPGQKCLKSDPSAALNRSCGTEISCNSLDLELTPKNKFSDPSLSGSQQTWNQHGVVTFLDDSIKSGKRTSTPKDHLCSGRDKSGSGCFYEIPDSVENKKEFSVVTRDTYRSTNPNQMTPKSVSKNLTETSESSDSEIRKLTGANLSESSQLRRMGKQGLEKQTELSSDIPVTQTGNMVSEGDPRRISRVGQTSYARPDILRLTNGNINGASSSEDGHGEDVAALSDGGSATKMHNENRNMAEEKKGSPFTYIVKVNQEETNVFYNVEATDYTVSTIRKHYAKNSPVNPLRKDVNGLEKSLVNKHQKNSSTLSGPVQSQKDTCRMKEDDGCMSDVQKIAGDSNNDGNRMTNSSAAQPRTKSSLSSQSLSSVSSSLLSSLSSSSSPPGQCQQSDDIPEPGLEGTLAANIPSTESPQKCDVWHEQKATAALHHSLPCKPSSRQQEEAPKFESDADDNSNIDQDQKLVPDVCKNLPARKSVQRPQTLPLSLGGPEFTTQQVCWVSNNPRSKDDDKHYTTISNSASSRVPKSSGKDCPHDTNINDGEPSNKRFNLPMELVSHNFGLCFPQQRVQKQSKVLTRCLSDSAISSDLTDIDSSNISPQPSHLPSWFSMQHVNYSCFSKNSDTNDCTGVYHVPTGAQKNVPSSSVQLSLKSCHAFKSSHEYVESLLKLKPFSSNRSLSMDDLNQWILEKDKGVSSVKNLENDMDYSNHLDMCRNDRQSEVLESDEPSNRFPRQHTCRSVPDKLARKRYTADLKDKGSDVDYQFQEDSKRDPTSYRDSSSSPSSASPYMVRCKNDGSLLNLSQEEFNNLEQNLPSDISSLVSSFDGCYLGHGQSSPDKEVYDLRGTKSKVIDFSSDDAAIGQKPRRARLPLRLPHSRHSSSGERLEANNIDHRVLHNLRRSKAAGQRDWTSTAESDETLYDYFNMPTYPPEEHGRGCPSESDTDTSDFQGPPEHFRRPRNKNKLQLYHSSKSASITDLPGDYPTSASSYRSVSPSISSELPGDLIPDEESLKYISIGIQASQTECATQTEDATNSSSDFTIPKHNNILKDSVASNMLPFPFNIPYLMAEASAGTFHTLPALMVETTNLLKNLSKQLTVEPSTTKSSLEGTSEKSNPKCSVTTQTELGQRQRQTEILSQTPLPHVSGMCGSSYSSPASSIQYSASYQFDPGNSFYTSPRPHPDINIPQNNFHPGMAINHDLMHGQNYMHPHFTPNPASSNTYPFPYHPQQPEMHGSLPNRRDMHLPVGAETGTLKSNSSMGEFWKGDMCDSFTYIPQHQSLPKDEMPSPGQRSYPSFGPPTRISPQDQALHLHASQILTPPDANTGPYQNSLPQHNFDEGSDRFNRQFKFNQTSPLPAWNYDKYYHSMKYQSTNSGKKPWNDLINYSEYNLDSTARDVRFHPDWRMAGGENYVFDQQTTPHNLQNHDISASAPGRFQNSMFDSHTPKPRFRSMTMDSSTCYQSRPHNLYGPMFQGSRTLPHPGLASHGDNLVSPREFGTTNNYTSTPRTQQHPRSKSAGVDAGSFPSGGNQPGHCLDEDLNNSLKKSGLTDEYLQLLNKSVRSLPKTERSEMPASNRHIRDPKTHKILEEASKLLDNNSSHSQIPSETNEARSYPELVNEAKFCGSERPEGNLNSACSVDQSKDNDLSYVQKIYEEYSQMIASDGKPAADTTKNSTIRHKSKSQKRQALHNQFKEWEKEQLEVIDRVNLKYLPVSFTVKYLEKKLNHCIEHTDLLLDSLDDEDPTTSSATSKNSTTMEDVFESCSASNARFSNLSMDYLRLPEQQNNSRQRTRSLSNSSLHEVSFDTGSELSPDALLQLHSSIPNLLTDDAATDRDVSWTDEMGYLHHEADCPIDTLTYTKSSLASSMTDLSSQDNSDQTISESQDLSSQGSLGKDAMSMLEEVSRFRKFYSAEIEKIRDGLTEIDVRVSAHQSPSNSRGSKRYSQSKLHISSCDNSSRSECTLNAAAPFNQMYRSKNCISDTSTPKRCHSSPLTSKRRASTDH